MVGTFRRGAILGVVLLGTVAHAADWPGFRGPNHDGIAPETGVRREWASRPPELLWELPLGDDGYAGPAVAGGVLYIVDHRGDEDVVRAVDTRNGRELWTHAYPESSGDNYGHARATPAVDGERLYVLSRFGLLTCLETRSGKKIWSRDIVGDFGGQRPKWDFAVSPLVDRDRVIVCPGGRDAAVAALDKETGRTLWTGGGSDKPGYATPVLATIEGREQYVVFTGYALIGVDRKDGALLWRFPWETDHDVNAATPIVTEDGIFISSGYNHGCALVEVRGSRATARWQSRDLVAHFNSPILSRGFIYGIGDPGNLVCIEAATGRLAWSQKGFEKGGVVGVDGLLIALGGSNGDLVLAEMTPEAYRELGRTRPLGGRSWTAPIVAQGKLYIRNQSKLACLSLK
jgi:outer membrane protein assembly factor BamB